MGTYKPQTNTKRYTNMVRFSILFVFLAATANAFAPVPASTNMKTVPTQLNAGFTAAELENIIMKGRECEKGECSVSDVDMLVGELMEQQHILSERVKEVENMIKSLEFLESAMDLRPS